MSAHRPAVFFDRDGTLIVDADYLSDPDGVTLIPGAPESIRAARDAGWFTVVVTNQSGIGRGLYSESDYRAVDRRFQALLAAEGATLDAVLHCPHHPSFTGVCDCRKPAPGMLLEAARRLGIDLARSVVVGDKRSDLEAGLAVGAAPILVRTGYGAATEAGGDLPAGTRVIDSVRELPAEPGFGSAPPR